MPGCENILSVKQAGRSLGVGFVYVVSEDESLMYGGF